MQNLLIRQKRIKLLKNQGFNIHNNFVRPIEFFTNGGFLKWKPIFERLLALFQLVLQAGTTLKNRPFFTALTGVNITVMIQCYFFAHC